jgi:hypothetical protein
MLMSGHYLRETVGDTASAPDPFGGAQSTGLEADDRLGPDLGKQGRHMPSSGTLRRPYIEVVRQYGVLVYIAPELYDYSLSRDHGRKMPAFGVSDARLSCGQEGDYNRIPFVETLQRH